MGCIGIVILAAGASTRLGHPKQLLPYSGKPLIRYMTEVAIDSGCQPVVVVLGAYAQILEPHLTHLSIHIAFNDRWSRGIASSIQCGLKQIQAISPHLDAIILMLCDQPFVSTHLIQQLVAGYQTTNFSIIASQYAGVLGVPALFDKTLFPELITLKGDVGARQIIRRYYSRVLSIPFLEGAIDLDTPQDIERLSPPTSF